jgi:hypothetical protein
MVAGFFLMFFLLMIGSPLPATVFTLVFGWWESASRLLHGWHPTISSALVFGAFVAILVIGSQRFLTWIYACLNGKQELSADKWRWKWTLCGYAVATCALFAIGSLMLVTHQLYWLSESSDPLFTDSRHERVEAVLAVNFLRDRFEADDWNSAKIRSEFWQIKLNGFDQPICERFQPVWIENDEQTLAAIVLIPRHPLHRSWARLAIIRPGTIDTTRSLEELPEVLASFEIGRTNAAKTAAMPQS